MDLPARLVDDLDAVTADTVGETHGRRELIAGVLRPLPPPSAAGLRTVADLATALRAATRDHRVAVRAALAIGPDDLLVPELVVVRPTWLPTPDPFGDGAAPQRGARRALRWDAGGVALAVFVGEDEAPLRWRAHRCARASVREVWTIAPDERRASRWRAPVDGRYTRRDPLEPGEAVAPDALPEQRVVAWR
jgi:hypothetical protein